MAWDLSIFNWIHGLAGWSVFMDSIGVFFAQYLAYLLEIAALVFVFKQGEWKSRIRVFLHLVLAVFISRGIIAEIIRQIYDRPRPFAAMGFQSLIGESGASFPSGHASLLFALGFVIFTMNRRWGWWFLALSLVNGIARVFVGVHYPSDILGGILVGLAGWAAVYFLLERKNKNASPQEIQPEAGARD